MKVASSSNNNNHHYQPQKQRVALRACGGGRIQTRSEPNTAHQNHSVLNNDDHKDNNDDCCACQSIARHLNLHAGLLRLLAQYTSQQRSQALRSSRASSVYIRTKSEIDRSRARQRENGLNKRLVRITNQLQPGCHDDHETAPRLSPRRGSFVRNSP